MLGTFNAAELIIHKMTKEALMVCVGKLLDHWLFIERIGPVVHCFFGEKSYSTRVNIL